MKEGVTADYIIGLYKEGYTDIEVCAECEMTRKEFEHRLKSQPVFREVIEMGRDAAEAWNLRQSRLHLKDKDFNTALFNSRMQNLYGWSQKVDQNTKSLNVNAEMTKEQLIEKLKEHVPGLLQQQPTAISHDPTDEAEFQEPQGGLNE